MTARWRGNEIVFVAGARPNFMKVAPLLRALDAGGSELRSFLVHTGQHYDEEMSDIFFQQLNIKRPDVSLDVGSGAHGAQTARILERFEELLIGGEGRPRGVVVVGDVNSTVACTLAAVKQNIPAAHVEAGLRSFDRTMPEEINRLATDAIADLLLVSEESGVENLRREGVAEERIRLVGNVMIDTLAFELPRAKELDVPATMGISGDYALVTLHRPSNVDDEGTLTRLVAFMEDIARSLEVVFPIHPRTRERLTRFQLYDRLAAAPGVRLANPLGYHEAVSLMSSARIVYTDSGGIQEETTFLGIPCLTLRQNTERPATVSYGTNTLVGNDLDLARTLTADVLAGRYKKGAPVPLWDGHAAERAMEEIARSWR